MMTPELWIRLKPLFNEAIERPLEERQAFIEEACGEDCDLKRELELLVIADAQLGTTAGNPVKYLRALLSETICFSPGEIILERFKIIRLVGSGGMGEVYEALDLELGRIALKTIRHDFAASDNVMARFKHEVQLARQVSDPHVCRIHELFVAPQCELRPAIVFLTMEFLEGVTLSDRLAQNGAIGYPEAQSIALQLCEGLQAIHNAGIIHRDLKARNIMLIPSEQNTRVVVMDFGVARLASRQEPLNASDMTEPDALVGTPEYMAPEQFENGPLSAATDVYALGIILYQLATGRHPFAARTPAAAAVRRAKHPAPASSIQPTVPKHWDKVIDRCLEYDAERRFQSAAEVADHLRRRSFVRRKNLPVVHGLRSIRGGYPKAIYVLSALVSIAMVVGIIWWRESTGSWHSHDPSQRQVLLIGSFDNGTGEPEFDSMLQEMFSAALQQSRYIAVFPASRLEAALQAMGRPPSEPVNEKIGLEICQRTGSSGLLTGSIKRLGSQYTIYVHAETPKGDNVLTTAKTVTELSKLGPAVDSVAERIRRAFGESKNSVGLNSLPLEQVTSPSLEAVRYYSQGKKALYTGDVHDALSLLENAVDLDPKFAMAHDQLGVAYEHLERFDQQVEELREASSQIDRVSEPERLKILGDYHDAFMDYDKACGFFKILSTLQPEDPAPLVNLGFCQTYIFDYDGAIKSTEKALALLPNSRIEINLASQLFLKGDNATALEIAKKAVSEYPEDMFAEGMLGDIYASVGRSDDARLAFESMISKGSDSAAAGHIRLADLELASGKYEDAAAELNAASLAAKAAHNDSLATTAELMLSELWMGNKSESKAKLALLSTQRLPDSPVLLFLVGRANAQIGNDETATQSLHNLELLADKYGSAPIRSLVLLLRSEIALSEGKTSEAVANSERAVAYYHSIFALETLARCHVHGSMFRQAINELEELLVHENQREAGFDAPALRHVVSAHYTLAVLYQKSGMNANARKHLAIFLKDWHDADRNLPVYKAAQRLSALIGERGMPTPAM